jgi:hypothetical protein
MPSRRLPAELAEEERLIIDPFAPLILPLQHADAASIEKLYTQEGCTMQVSFFMPCSQPRCSDAEPSQHAHPASAAAHCHLTACSSTSRSTTLMSSGACWQHWSASWAAWWAATRTSHHRALRVSCQQQQPLQQIRRCECCVRMAGWHDGCHSHTTLLEHRTGALCPSHVSQA